MQRAVRDDDQVLGAHQRIRERRDQLLPERIQTGVGAALPARQHRLGLLDRDLGHALKLEVQAVERRLLFASGEYEVLFRIAPSSAPDAFSFVGQVLHGGLPLGSAAVRKTDDGETFVTDQTGGFRLPSIAAGAHRFEVATHEGVIELAPITVGASR